MAAKLPQVLARGLAETAKKIATPGKGILNIDSKDAIKGETDEARERQFTQVARSNRLSGVILYEETFAQKASSGKWMAELLLEQGLVAGIQVDLGVVTLPGTDDEKATQGLDKLAERCKKYYNQGARFATWRAVLSIDLTKNKPSAVSIAETAHTLARYAGICQCEGLVPVIEPELLPDGSHSIEACAEVMERVLAAVFKALHDQNVLLEGCVLRSGWVQAGSNAKKSTPEEIAYYTIRTRKRTVPPALLYIDHAFAGKSEEDALNEMNRIKN